MSDPPITAATRSVSPRVLLALLLVAAGLRGIGWSLALPPLHPNDEAQHFLRVREAAGDLPESATAGDGGSAARVPLDAHLLAGLVGYGTVERDADLKLPLGDARSVRASLAELARPGAQSTPVPDEPNRLVRHKRFALYHPPFFYEFMALPYRLVAGRVITLQLLALRAAAVAMGLIVVAVAFGVGRVLWPAAPGRAAALGTLAAFQPMGGFYFSVVNNESMATLWLSGVLALLFYVTRRRLTPWGAVGLGLLTSAGLLTKASFALVVPLFAAVILWQLVRRRAGRAVWPWVVVALVPTTLTAWWYLPAATRETRVMQSHHRPQRPAAVSVASYVRNNSWGLQYRSIVSEYWGGSLGNAWPGDAAVPRPVRQAWCAASAAGLLATLGWLVWRALSRDGYGRGYGGGLLLLGLATPCLIAFYQYLDYRYVVDTGGHYGLRGQYFLPALLGQMLWLLFGLGLLARGRWRAALVWALSAGMIVTNLDALFGRVMPRYYGAAGLADAIRQIALLQPVSGATAWAVYLLLPLACLGLLVALAVRLWAERELPWLDTDDGAEPTGRTPPSVD